MKLKIAFWLGAAFLSQAMGDHGHGHHHHHGGHQQGGSYGNHDHEEPEEPIRVIVQKAGPSQTFKWLGNGHDEHIHPRPPPVRPTYLFMGRPDFVVNYVANNNRNAGHGQHQHHQQQSSGHHGGQGHGHQSHGHGGHAHTNTGYPSVSFGQPGPRQNGHHDHGHGHGLPSAVVPPVPQSGNKVFDPVTPLYKLPAGSGAPVGDHPLPPPPPPLVDGVPQQELQYPPFGGAEKHPTHNSPYSQGLNQEHSHSPGDTQTNIVIGVQVDDPSAIPDLGDNEDPSSSGVTQAPEDDIVTAAVAEHNFEETHRGAASSNQEIRLRPQGIHPKDIQDAEDGDLFTFH